jgi:hypothetical protein
MPFDRDMIKQAAAKFAAKTDVYWHVKRKTFIYVNNQLEGNALETIATTLENGLVRLNLMQHVN